MRTKASIFLLLLLAVFALKAHSQNQIVNPTIALDGDMGSVLVNTIAALINKSQNADEDCFYYDDCNRVNGRRMHFGGELKLNFNLHNRLIVSGGYRILSMPYDRYGDEIISKGFYLEPQINLSNDFYDTAFIFAQFGKTTFNTVNIVPHWQYTLGFGYKIDSLSLDLGYNFFNAPLEQQSEFTVIEDRIFRTQESFLNTGYTMLRLSFNLF